jgi:uncharacterized protein (DUF885 family)
MNKKNFIGQVTTCLVLLLATLPVQADPGTELQQFFDDVWERELAQQPLFASNVNRHEYDNRLPDVSADNLARRAQDWRSDLERLDRIDVTSLEREDQVSAALFRQQHQVRLRGFELHHYELAMGTQAGFLFDLLYMVNKAPRASEADYLNYLARLEAIPEFLDQNTELMRAGLKRGMTQPRAIMGEIEALAAEFLVEDPRASIFWQPFADMPSSISAGQQ